MALFGTFIQFGDRPDCSEDGAGLSAESGGMVDGASGSAAGGCLVDVCAVSQDEVRCIGVGCGVCGGGGGAQGSRRSAKDRVLIRAG